MLIGISTTIGLSSFNNVSIVIGYKSLDTICMLPNYVSFPIFSCSIAKLALDSMIYTSVIKRYANSKMISDGN